jgi:hypothetical protein
MKKTSFGEYFDNQRDKFVKDMQDKNKQLNVEWMERYNKRMKEKEENEKSLYKHLTSSPEYVNIVV